MASFAGFGVRGYRSFGSQDIVRIGPTKKLHLIAGRNNTGKSNTLKFLHDVIGSMRSGQATQDQIFGHIDDEPKGWTGEFPKSLSLCFVADESLWQHLRIESYPEYQDVFHQEAYSHGREGYVWFDFDIINPSRMVTSANSLLSLVPDANQFQSALHQAGSNLDSSSFARLVSSQTSSVLAENLKSYFLSVALWASVPKLQWVGAIREITQLPQGMTGVKPDPLSSGQGLITALAQLERPLPTTRGVDRPKFDALRQLVCDVLDDPLAEVEIPRAETTITVVDGAGRALGLESLGTGISEVIMLAAAATTLSSQIICIEEPELHLHPALQRKLIKYLHNNTDNRYLISTHSASLLNAGVASISHITMRAGHSIVDHVLTGDHQYRAVADLGNRASDLVQSDYIIWVEGPSDRIYLTYWISLAAPDLIEGSHYTVMFYGGGLLNHLSAGSDNADELIELILINRSFSIVIDSDRRSADDSLNATKQRIIDELSGQEGFAWVTDGYTIENYVPASSLELAIQQAHPRSTYSFVDDQFASPLGDTFTGSDSKPDKVKVARRVVDQSIPQSGWSAELLVHVLELVTRIKAANGLS